MANLHFQGEAKRSVSRSEALSKEVKGELEVYKYTLPDVEGHIKKRTGRKTLKITQQELRHSAPVQNSKKMFSLDLSEEHSGKYGATYTRDGRFLLLASEKGHYSAFDWQTGKLYCEGHLEDGEQIRDSVWLHNESFFALAQRNYVYIYDNSGVEIHRLDKHQHASHLEFLPYHFLLTSTSSDGFLRYQDISTGSLVAEISIKSAGKRSGQSTMGQCTSMKQNRQNGIVHLGHANGVVSLWSPSLNTPLVQMKCHPCTIASLAIAYDGVHMVTASADGRIKIWDLRSFQKVDEMHAPRTPSDIGVSQRGHLAVGNGPHVTVWKDAFIQSQREPFLDHLFKSRIVSSVEFCPFEDILGVGHSSGFDSLLMPGSGEPNYDSFDADPYASKKQRQTLEVRSLLEKIPADAIGLDQKIGQISSLSRKAQHPAAGRKPPSGRPRGSPGHRLHEDSSGVHSEREETVEIKRLAEKAPDFAAGSALQRFVPKDA